MILYHFFLLSATISKDTNDRYVVLIWLLLFLCGQQLLMLLGVFEAAVFVLFAAAAGAGVVAADGYAIGGPERSRGAALDYRFRAHPLATARGKPLTLLKHDNRVRLHHVEWKMFYADSNGRHRRRYYADLSSQPAHSYSHHPYIPDRQASE